MTLKKNILMDLIKQATFNEIKCLSTKMFLINEKSLKNILI